MSIPVSTLTGSNTINQMMYNVNTIKDLAANSASSLTGPGSSTDNAVVRFDGTSGLTAQNSGVTIADDNSMIISGSSSGDMLRITQTGAGNALVVEDSTNPDSTPFVVDSSGNLLIGTTTVLYDGVGPMLVQESSSSSGPQQGLRNTTVDNKGSYFIMEKSRSGGIVSFGDTLGTIRFRGHDGTNYIAGADIYAAADGIGGGAPGTNDLPTRLVFATTADGASTPTERMRIDSNGNLLVGTTTAPTTVSPVAIDGSIALEVAPTGTETVGIYSEATGDATSERRAAIEFVHTAGGGGSDSVITFTTNDFGASRAERMRIDSSGNVGIGTSNPDKRLHVLSTDVNGGVAVFENTSSTQYATGGIIVKNGASSSGKHVLIGTSVRDGDGSDSVFTINRVNDDATLTFDAGLATYDLTADFWTFKTNDTERLRIDSSGLVGIGRTPTTNLLEVAGTIESTSGGFKFPDGSTQTSAASAGITTGKAIAMAIVFG